ncbi:MAG: HAD family hydrolase [Firmicutes bacterium]|nr:HAD family hydrolase [Bacillota bacterium]
MKQRNELSLKKQKILDDIGLIALDLDRTTLTKKGLTDNTKECLEEAISRGYQVVIATGRPYAALPECLWDINGLRYVICSNGAHIADLSSGEFVFSDCLSEEASSWCMEYLYNACFPIEVFTEGGAYIERERYEKIKSSEDAMEGKEYIINTRKPVDDIWQFWRDHISRIENINVIFNDPSDKTSVYEELSSNKDKGFTVTSSMFYNLEIGGANTSKANALSELSLLSGIPLKRIMSFGDSPNDSAMIIESGFGVAMGNAEQEVKEQADYVTLSNEEEGVSFAIRTLLFKETK